MAFLFPKLLSVMSLAGGMPGAGRTGVRARGRGTHDGSLRTLEDVIEHNDRGGTANPYLDPDIERLELTLEEKRALLEFVRALTGDDKRLARFACPSSYWPFPFAPAACHTPFYLLDSTRPAIAARAAA